MIVLASPDQEPPLDTITLTVTYLMMLDAGNVLLVWLSKNIISAAAALQVQHRVL